MPAGENGGLKTIKKSLSMDVMMLRVRSSPSSLPSEHNANTAYRLQEKNERRSNNSTRSRRSGSGFSPVPSWQLLLHLLHFEDFKNIIGRMSARDCAGI